MQAPLRSQSSTASPVLRTERPTLPASFEPSAALRASPFLTALRGEPTPYTPVWLMRQAGRTMTEYRRLREKLSFLELCESAGDCAEMAVLARERLNADAAIVFSDILTVVRPLGFDLDYAAGEGPVIGNPVRSPADVSRMREPNAVADLGFVMEAVRATRAALPATTPLIGFAGAPFTVASYLLEGGKSKNFLATKLFMVSHEAAWTELMQRLVAITVDYLNAQVEAGAQALQLFDSWVGALAPADYARYVQPHVSDLFDGLYQGVPVIHYGAPNADLATLMAAAGGDAVSLDFRAPLSRSWERAATSALQGNIDPCLLLAPEAAMFEHADRVLAEAAGRPGHVFNLGGGLLPETDFSQAVALVRHVHDATRRA